MEDRRLTKSEIESVLRALEHILDQPVGEIDLTNEIPPVADVPDSNKVFKGKLSVLFVDMRKSTDLTDELKAKKMVKIYRAFIRIAIQAIRYSRGYTRQFAGDGLMGVFQDSVEGDAVVTSAHKAVTAARYIQTLVDFCLNPALKKCFDDVCIGCGVGICTGTIMITKVGMRGRESDETTENETGIVWVGSTTNYASRYCSLAAAGEVFVDECTYSEIESSEIWKKASRVKGDKVFSGYVADRYYLDLPDDFEQEPIQAESAEDSGISFVQKIFDETQNRALNLVDEISKKSAELSVALEKVRHREQQVTARENEARKEATRLKEWDSSLTTRQNAIDRAERRNNEAAYKAHRYFFSNTFCKQQVIAACGKDYWLGLIETAFELGEKIGKTKLDVRKDLACYLVDIYLCFELYEEAYDAYCIQAQYSSWISIYKLETVVKKSGHWLKLRGILEKRVREEKDFEKGLQILKSMGY